VAGREAAKRARAGGKGGKDKEEDKEDEAPESAVQELLRVADLFQAGGLYEHCLGEFGHALTVETAVQQLVWAHAHAPEGARAVAMEYVVANCRAIQVVVACLYLALGCLFILVTCSRKHIQQLLGSV
jgi:hypothetical protein